jgi:putative oxidoreductase
MVGAEIRQSKFHDISHFGLRLAIGTIFIVLGYAKFDPSFVNYLPQVGLPTELQYLYALEEFVPGILIILGILTRISASVLSLVMLGVIFYIDKASQFIGSNGAELPVILLAASLVIITIGPGRISISHLVKKIPRFLQ